MLQEVKNRINELELNKIWDKKYGNHERIVNTLTNTIFKDNKLLLLKHILKNKKVGMLDKIVCRYELLDYLTDQGELNKENLSGFIVDISSHRGLSIDSLAMYGGVVHGTDFGAYEFKSPSGIDIDAYEGISLLEHQRYNNKMPNLVTCFNADWVENMSEENWCEKLFNFCLKNMPNKGQVLLTFGNDYNYKHLTKKGMIDIEPPNQLKKSEKYILIGTK